MNGIGPNVLAASKATRTSEYILMVVHAALEKPLKFKAGGIANSTVMNTICPANLSELLDSYD
ncbi:hypothetical protein BKA63DRAFT_514114 [Paraphoma chrysanthemicola]|nr:hypothetical protein BKA63DRAFT_514114 [Paraphoma chrysanthemicola]